MQTHWHATAKIGGILLLGGGENGVKTRIITEIRAAPTQKKARAFGNPRSWARSDTNAKCKARAFGNPRSWARSDLTQNAKRGLLWGTRTPIHFRPRSVKSDQTN